MDALSLSTQNNSYLTIDTLSFDYEVPKLSCLTIDTLSFDYEVPAFSCLTIDTLSLGNEVPTRLLRLCPLAMS